MTRTETLRGQLAHSLLRFTELQRRAERTARSDNLLARAFGELERALSELEVAVDEIRDQNAHIEMARAEADAERGRWQTLFERAPLPYVLTDCNAVIRTVNEAGAALLAISRRFLVGKALTVFVDGRRVEFLDAVARAAMSDSPVDIAFTLRPRERAPYAVGAIVHRFRLPDGTRGLWWIFEKRVAPEASEFAEVSEVPPAPMVPEERNTQGT